MTVEAETERPPPAKFDAAASAFVAIFGKKGSGKSVLGRHIFESYPHDRIVIDVTGDEGGLAAAQTIREIPDRWPVEASSLIAPGHRKRQTLRYLPDMGSPTHREDLDRAIGIAYQHRRTCAWVDEVMQVFPAGRTGPWGTRALHQGRHRQLSLILCGPRPVDIDPLVLSQADRVYLFQMLHPLDIARAAGHMGVDPKRLEAAVRALPRFGYLCFDAAAPPDDNLWEYPPLPVPDPNRPRPQHDDPDR